MAEFKSKYPELGFYVDGEFKSFKNGVYKTESQDEIKILSELTDVTRIDKPTGEAASKPAAKKRPSPQSLSPMCGTARPTRLCWVKSTWPKSGLASR